MNKAIALVSVSLVAGCVEIGEDDSLERAEAALCGISVNAKRSLIVHRADPTAANGSTTILNAFSFKAVMTKLVATAPGVTTSPAGLFQQWMSVAEPASSVGAVGPYHCNGAPIDPSKWGYQCPRDADAALADRDPFTPADAFVPVALVNRVDLTPADQANCGEYRIVFARNSTSIVSRFFMIFEAKLANPGGVGSLAGCKAVAEFWQKQSDPALTPTQRRDALKAFYFDGVSVNVAGLGPKKTEPVIHWKNYSFGSGQLRTNQFMTDPWTLREFKLENACPTAANCRLLARPVQVKQNIAIPLLRDATQTLHADAIAAVNAQLTPRRLLATSVAGIAAVIPLRVNAWESAASGKAVTAYTTIGAASKAKIVMPAGVVLTKDQLLNRLETQSCMGCHQTAAGKDLGGGLTWPQSLGFVHIDERGALSPALETTFLPARQRFFETLVKSGCSVRAESALTFKEDGATN